MLQDLSQNPFRVLGVFSNSPQKDIVRNISKLRAYISTNKDISFPLDLNDALPPVVRTLDSVQQAQGRINLPGDKILSALFWFHVSSPVDQIALDNLCAGNRDKSISILRNHPSISSNINLNVIYLIGDDVVNAVDCISPLFSSVSDFTAFVHSVCGDTTDIDINEIRSSYFELIINGYDIDSILDDIIGSRNSDNVVSFDYFKRAISAHYLDYIHSEISSAIEKGKLSTDSAYRAGRALMSHTKTKLNSLKRILGQNSIEFQSIADKLAKSILQLGINYYNGSDEDKRAKISKAKSLQEYALSIAEGKLIHDRCQLNVDILSKHEAQLPPKEIELEHQAIYHKVGTFNNLPTINIKVINSFLSSCLKPLVSIKEKLGSTDQQFVKYSTLIVSAALNKLIDVVNESIEKANDSSILSVFSVKQVVEDAWEITCNMEAFPMETDFYNNRFFPNKNSLLSIASQLGIITDKTIFSKFDLRTETERYNACSSISSYAAYLRDFPDGKFCVQANAEIKRLTDAEDDCAFAKCSSIDHYKKYLSNIAYKRHREEAEKRLSKLVDDQDFVFCKTIVDYSSYITNHPNGSHVQEANQKVLELKDKARRKKITSAIVWSTLSICAIALIVFLCLTADDRKFSNIPQTIYGYSSYVESFPNGKHSNEAYKALLEIYQREGISGLADFIANYPNNVYCDIAQAEVSKIRDSLYNIADKKNTISSWVKFSEEIPITYQKDASDRIKVLCDALYAQALRQNSIDSWNKYVESVPEGELRDSHDKLNECYENLYNKTLSTNTISAWNSFKKQVPTSEYRDADSHLKRLEEEQKWKTESSAWSEASSGNSINLYQKYLQYHPNGSHSSAAKKRIIDLKVNAVSYGEHGTLPAMDHDYYSYGSSSTVTITNDTGYTMTALYSGQSQSKELTIPPHGTRSVSLVNGTYRIAVSVSAGNVHGYYGSENLSGGNYSASYYIVTTRY
ncbi:MAG: hypothetical protein KBS72_03705 [Bacteroidales bacterium]|nr:hypothetical protein [Candidatus Cacconaster scatequi]